MKRTITIHDIDFELCNYTPRKNDFEKGLKYRLYVGGIPTNTLFNTLKSGRSWIYQNYFIYL